MRNQPWSLHNNQLTLYCHVQPGARQNRITGLYDQRLRIQIMATPTDGKANKVLIEFIARTCSRPKSEVRLLAGQRSRKKTIIINGLQQIPDSIKKWG